MIAVIEAKNEKGKEALKTIIDANKKRLLQMVRLGNRFKVRNDEPYSIEFSNKAMSIFAKGTPHSKNLEQPLTLSIEQMVADTKVGATGKDIKVTFE